MTPPGASPEFIAEAQEIVDALNRDLITAESETRSGEVDPDRINSLFRSAHSLKGISGMFGLDVVSHLAHELESVLDAMRLGRVRFDASALDVLFACVEKFGELIVAADRDLPADADTIAELVARLHTVAEGTDAAGQGELLELVDLGEDVLSVLTEYEEHRLRENLKRGRSLYMLRSSFDLSNFDVGLAEIDAAVKDVGEVITKLPSSEATDPGTISFDIIAGADVAIEELESAISDDRVQVLPIRRRAVVAPATPEPAAVPEPVRQPTDDSVSIKSVSRTVRVDIRRLDKLMNLVGELGLTRMAYQRLGEAMRRERGFSELAAELHKEGRNFERRLNELQAGIMEVRMVPLANLFERMVRVGRKISRELGREVRIAVSGEHTELDKLIVEDLADPLMHLIRNAIDHGIESPAERAEANKSVEGVVRLHAAARGNHVIVEVEDDGRGINLEHMLSTAIDSGLVTSERARELNRREVFGLLFLPGFSTRQKVSEYSGRGVGMDVVKTAISQLSGVIDIDSVEGRGTKVSVTLPITLAIIPALIVHVAGRTYAIPLNNVQETLAIDQYTVRTIERQEVIAVRGTTVPLIDLRKAFGLHSGAARLPEAKATSGAATAPEANISNASETTGRPDVSYGVIAGVGHNQMALVVDELVGQQDIVIKSLGRRLRNVPGIAGAAELGNQQTILVIDMVGLLTEMAAGHDVVRSVP